MYSYLNHLNVLVKPTTDHKRKLILQKGNRSRITYSCVFKLSLSARFQDFAAITKL
jgi:hypothetical protein